MTIQDRPIDDEDTRVLEKKETYDYADLIACANGELGNLPRLPAPPMLMLSWIWEIKQEGGKYGNGYAIADQDLRQSPWFFDCHFKSDPVMPGCLQLDALLQLTGFFAGWSGGRGKGRATGMGPSKFIGEIVPSSKFVRYRVDIKKVAISPKRSFARADGIVECAGKIVCTAEDLTAFITP